MLGMFPWRLGWFNEILGFSKVRDVWLSSLAFVISLLAPLQGTNDLTCTIIRSLHVKLLTTLLNLVVDGERTSLCGKSVPFR
jgi:hypothetical protein